MSKNTNLASTFYVYYQFSPYILVAVNLAHVIFTWSKVSWQYGLSIRLDTWHIYVCVFSFLFFFFFLASAAVVDQVSNEQYSAPVHCSWVLKTSPFSNFFIKNGSHSTIHTFKNYFTTVFSVFSFNKISSIQMNSKLTASWK